MASNDIKNGKRGTIILDSSAILRLVQPIDNTFLKKEDQNKGYALWDVLPKLARNGFDIVIPEMIALDCTGRLADGKHIERESLGSYSRHSNWIEHTRKRLRNIASSADVHILPPSQNDTSDQAQFLEKLKQSLRQGNKIELSPKTESSSKEQFYGVDSAIALVKHKECKNLPLFYLVNRKTPMHKMLDATEGENISVNMLNSAGFLEALKSEGLLSNIGIRDDVPSLKILDDIERMLQENHVIREPKDILSYLAENPLYAIDTNNHMLNNHAHPFASSLKGLGASSALKTDELPDSQPNVKSLQSEIQPDEDPQQIKKFNDREMLRRIKLNASQKTQEKKKQS